MLGSILKLGKFVLLIVCVTAILVSDIYSFLFILLEYKRGKNVYELMLMVKRMFGFTNLHDQVFWLAKSPYQKSADHINRFLVDFRLKHPNFIRNLKNEHSEIKFIIH